MIYLLKKNLNFYPKPSYTLQVLDNKSRVQIHDLPAGKVADNGGNSSYSSSSEIGDVHCTELGVLSGALY